MMAVGHYDTLQIKYASSMKRYPHLFSLDLARSRVVTVRAPQPLFISRFSSFQCESAFLTAFSLVKCLF